MIQRTTRRTVTFGSPFQLGGTGEFLPQGDYDVETDEELVEGLSFVAYRRVAAFLHLHSRDGAIRVMTVAPAVLDEALARDRSHIQPKNEVR